MSTVSIPASRSNSLQFAVRYSANFITMLSGVWSFTVTSNSAFSLFIDDALLGSNGAVGTAAAPTPFAMPAVKPCSRHSFYLLYYHFVGVPALNVTITDPSG